MASPDAGRGPRGESQNPKLKLKPVITELVRTQVCPKPLHLLLDRIAIVPVLANGKQQEAYRLWFSDGEKSIQGLIRYELHPFVTSGEIQEGSIVSLDDYQLTELPRQSGKGNVWILTVTDMRAIGSDGRDPHPPRLESLMGLPGIQSEGSDKSRSTTPATFLEEDKTTVSVSKPKIEIAYDEGNFNVANFQDPGGKNVGSGNDSEDYSDAFDPPPSPTPKRKQSARPDPYEGLSANGEPSSKKHKVGTDGRNRLSSNGSMKSESAVHQTGSLEPIKRPLKIIPLDRLTGRYRTRNKVHDILAVVCSVDSQLIRRPKMPAQRNLRITDTSTEKQVQLTIFVGAEDFTPPLGTVALFRNVTTHEWNGGSLKAYQRDCAGKKWYFPDPVDIDEEKVRELKTYWKRISSETKEDREQTGSGHGGKMSATG